MEVNMKRVSTIILMLAFICIYVSAAAEGNKPGSLIPTAVIEGGKVYYSGSVDGSEAGIFAMGLDGGNAKRLYEGDFPIIATTGGFIMASDYINNATVIINAADGSSYSIPGITGSAIGANGVFYTGYSEINAANSNVKTLFTVSDVEKWFIMPVAIEGEYIYYIDEREYSGYAAEYENPGSLMRVSLADGAITEISGAGTAYIGMDNQYIYYMRTSFYIYDEDSDINGVLADVDEGLFRAEKSGSGETRLADAGMTEDYIYVSFIFMDDGVIYGMRDDYNSDDGEMLELIRVNATGEALPNIQLTDNMSPHSVKDKKILTIASEYGTLEDETYWQRDTIRIIDLSGDEVTTLSISLNINCLLVYTESPPMLTRFNGRLYYVAYDIDAGAESLYSCNEDGSDMIKLALGNQYI
jgi:hypothetical protein